MFSNKFNTTHLHPDRKIEIFICVLGLSSSANATVYVKEEWYDSIEQDYSTKEIKRELKIVYPEFGGQVQNVVTHQTETILHETGSSEVDGNFNRFIIILHQVDRPLIVNSINIHY